MTSPAPLSIAVLGIGRMGLPMARRLCQAGHEVHVWNRTRAKADVLVADGATVYDSAVEAARQADITLSLLENGPAVAQVLFDLGVAEALRAGSLFIDMASIQPAEARHHAEQLGERGVAVLDAPVSGGTVGAESGTLAETLIEIEQDVQSSISYSGGKKLMDIRKVNYVILGGENASEHLM